MINDRIRRIRHSIAWHDYVPLLGTRSIVTTPEGVTTTDVYEVNYERGCVGERTPRQTARVVIEPWDGVPVEESP